ncbi:FAD-dependent oxidoreductase [Microbacteriaceae bacterium VKM Ac-2855]|nr:FAD-dependent oxidoreductase [Microbacteriaceae bacterium VKM Ac-2855]
MTSAERVVIVGASLAGTHTARSLRAQGHIGEIVLIGDEPHPPYDRPPLSKGLLSADRPFAVPVLTRPDELDVVWRLGETATALDRSRRAVQLHNGDSVGYDRLVIATGRRARPWDDPIESRIAGVFALRSFEDAHRLRAALADRAGRVVVVGAGFIGSEIASVARAHGVPVTVIARGRTPLDGALGESVGRIATGYYRRAGVDFRPNTAVVRIVDRDGRVAAVELDDGSTVSTDVVVIATGSLPNVEWLQGSGLDAGGGVAVDGRLRALDEAGAPDPRVFAAGDVTRWAHPLSEGRLRSVEHWGNAVEQAGHVARTIALHDQQQAEFAELPRYWSMMFGSNIKSVGVPSLGTEVVVVQGSALDRRGVVLYGRDGRTVGAVALDSPRELVFFDSLVAAGAPFPPRLTVTDWGSSPPPRPVPARFPDRLSRYADRDEGGTRANPAAGRPDGRLVP